MGITRHTWPYKCFCLSIVVTCSLYLLGLDGKFIIDDRTYFIDNDLLPNLSLFNLQSILFTPSNYWGEHLPVRDLLYLVQYLTFDKMPFGYHVVSFSLYILLLYLVFKLAECFFGSDLSLTEPDKHRLLPVAVTALFASFPTHVESVSYISGQKDLLCAVFSMAAMLTAARMNVRGGWNLRGGCLFIGFYYAAFLSKNLAVANIIIIPLMLAHQSGLRALLSRKNFAYWLLLNIPAIAWLAYSMNLVERYFGGTSQLTRTPLANRLVNAIEILGSHLQLIWSPFRLSFGYPFQPGNMFNLLIGCVALCLAILLAIRASRSLESLGGAIFFCYMLPVLQLFSPLNNSTIYDRYLLLPSLGLGLFGVALLRRKLSAAAVSVVILGLVATLSIAKYQYIPTYGSDVDVARNSYRKFPDWRSASFNLADSLMEAGEGQEVEKLLASEPAMADPAWVSPYFQGRIELQKGHLSNAIDLLTKASLLCQRGGYFPFPSNPLAEALLLRGDLPQARFWLNKVVESRIYNPLEYYRAKQKLREISDSLR